MMIVGLERWHEFADEILPLWQAHYKEIAWNLTKMPIDVDIDRYQAMDKNGTLKCFIARNEDGDIVGYAGWFVLRHLHYKQNLVAYNDVIYVDPTCRGRGLLKELLDASEAHFREIDVDVMTLHIKTKLDWGILAERRGYEKVELNFQKWIGD